MAQAEVPPQHCPAPEFLGMAIDPGVPGRGTLPQTLPALEFTKKARGTRKRLFMSQNSMLFPMLTHRRLGGGKDL